jgi:hypothetical protein
MAARELLRGNKTNATYFKILKRRAAKSLKNSRILLKLKTSVWSRHEIHIYICLMVPIKLAKAASEEWKDKGDEYS